MLTCIAQDINLQFVILRQLSPRMNRNDRKPEQQAIAIQAWLTKETGNSIEEGIVPHKGADIPSFYGRRVLGTGCLIVQIVIVPIMLLLFANSLTFPSCTPAGAGFDWFRHPSIPSSGQNSVIYSYELSLSARLP